MIMTLIFGAVAGAATPYLQPHVARLGKSILPGLEGESLAVASFAIALLLALVLLTVGASGGSAFWLLIGGLLGYFQAELRDAIKQRVG